NSLGVSRIGDADAPIALKLTTGREHGLVTAIARCNHHDHTGSDQALAFITDGRAAASIILDVVYQRKAQVHPVDDLPVRVRIEIADELQSRNDRKLIASPIVIEHSQIAQPYIRTHALPLRLNFGRLGGENTGDVRPVIER